MTPRWYCVSREGPATLCRDEADAGLGERDAGRPEPEHAETPLGVHWLGGRPYMLTSGPNAVRVRREQMHYSFRCYSCNKTWERRIATADCPRCGTTNNYCAANAT